MISWGPTPSDTHHSRSEDGEGEFTSEPAHKLTVGDLPLCESMSPNLKLAKLKKYGQIFPLYGMLMNPSQQRLSHLPYRARVHAWLPVTTIVKVINSFNFETQFCYRSTSLSLKHNSVTDQPAVSWNHNYHYRLYNAVHMTTMTFCFA